MPYITQERRADVADPKRPLPTAGDLTYQLYIECLHYHDAPPLLLEVALEDAIGRYMPRRIRYENYAIVLGCLDSCARELARRRSQQSIFARHTIKVFTEAYYRDEVAPYEDTKIEQNGDVT